MFGRRNPPQDPKARARSFAAGIVLVAFLWAGFVLRLRWVGSSGGRGGYAPILVPLVGCLGTVMTPLFWWGDRRRDFLGEPRRRLLYLTFLVCSLLWTATWPLGNLIERASAEASKPRALEVATAAEAYRDAVGRWPETVQEIEARTGVRLPLPTLGRQWWLRRGDDTLEIEFGADSFVSTHMWRYDVRTMTWDDYGN